MRKLLLTLFLTGLLFTGGMQGVNAQCKAPDFKLLRYEERYHYLGKDSVGQKTLWEKLKFRPLNRTKTMHLSVGGDLRWQYEYINQMNWGEGPEDNNGYLLQRYMVHTDWQLGKYLRVFGQLKSGIETGKNGGPEPPDEDHLDLHQAFADFRLPLPPRGAGLLAARVGRQELSYGSSRLVSVREGPNVRQSFDAIKVFYQGPPGQLDAFVSRPVETNPGTFDDPWDKNRLFWGMYGVKPLPGFCKGNVDLYYFGLRENNAVFAAGVANEIRHSAGLRWWSKASRVQYNLEGVYQLGSFGNGAIRAYTLSGELTYAFKGVPLQPFLNLKAEIISGDRRREDGHLQTFNPLFPKGAYFGQIALIGPANLVDVHPLVGCYPVPAVAVTLDGDFFWRESRGDGLYGVPYVLLREGNASQSRHIGNQFTMELDWQMNPLVNLQLFCTYFVAGPFLRETGAGRDLTFLAPRLTVRF